MGFLCPHTTKISYPKGVEAERILCQHVLNCTSTPGRRYSMAAINPRWNDRHDLILSMENYYLTIFDG
jgi:hypothetical protein